MSTFKSTTVINKPVADIYQYLTDMNNHERLMPEDISNWSSTANEASFTIRNMINLSLKIDGNVSGNEIRIIPAVKPPFELELKWILSPSGDGTEAKFIINAELNMMMKMMASGPLQKLADHEVKMLHSHFQ